MLPTPSPPPPTPLRNSRPYTTTIVALRNYLRCCHCSPHHCHCHHHSLRRHPRQFSLRRSLRFCQVSGKQKTLDETFCIQVSLNKNGERIVPAGFLAPARGASAERRKRERKAQARAQGASESARRKRERGLMIKTSPSLSTADGFLEPLLHNG